MTIPVLFFAAAQERVGLSSTLLALHNDATLGELREELLHKFATLGDLLHRCTMAVNHEFAPDSTVLQPGDEVAVIPPVSGG